MVKITDFNKFKEAQYYIDNGASQEEIDIINNIQNEITSKYVNSSISKVELIAELTKYKTAYELLSFHVFDK